jgi:hypothetical protein
VRVDEVQDALKRLMDTFQSKLDTSAERLGLELSVKNEESLSKVQNTYDLIHAKIREQHQSILQMEDKVRAEKKQAQQNFDYLNEALGSLSKEMLLKANI